MEHSLNLFARSPQTTLLGITYGFASWSDRKEQQHDFVTDPTPSSYTANFKAYTKTGTSAGQILDGNSNSS